MIYETISPVLGVINLYPCDKGFVTKERFIPNHYFLYVHSGTGKFIIDSQIYDAQAGDLFFCPANIGNIIEASESNPFVLSGIDFFFWENEIGNLKIYSEDVSVIVNYFLPKSTLKTNPFALHLIQEMIDAFTNKTKASQSYCNSLLKTFILNQINISQTFSNTNGDKRLEILKYLSINSHESITIMDIAHIFNYHPNTLNRMIKNLTGMSIKEYQIDARIKKSMDLLLYSNKSITEIAAICGYQSVFFFSRQFKNKTGIMPTKYRNQLNT